MNKNQIKNFSFSLFVSATLLFFLSSFNHPNINDDSFGKLKELRLQVLKENVIGKDYEYDLTGIKGCNKTKLTYLGILTTKRQKKYKILNSFWVTGQNCKGISRIVIYDTNNVYIGNYPMQHPKNLPDALVDGCIVYNEDSDECEGRKGTKISFKSGLPNRFYLQCGGDHFYFHGDE